MLLAQPAIQIGHARAVARQAVRDHARIDSIYRSRCVRLTTRTARCDVEFSFVTGVFVDPDTLASSPTEALCSARVYVTRYRYRYDGIVTGNATTIGTSDMAYDCLTW